MIDVSLIDRDRLAAEPDALAATSLGAAARGYLEAFIREGVSTFITNGQGIEAAVLVVNGKALPVAHVVAEPKAWIGRTTSIFSPYGHYLLYPVDEIGGASGIWTPRRLRAALSPLDRLLRWGRIDRVLYLNHWLISAQPAMALHRAELEAATATLTARFPDAAIVVPAVVPLLGKDDDCMLDAAGYRRVQSRVIYLLDPRSGRHHGKRNIRQDRPLVRRSRLDVVEDRSEILPHAATLARLYDELYIGKHSALNPRYTEAFFRIAVESGLFEARIWRRPGTTEPYAFCLRLTEAETIRWAAIGYDLLAPREAKLYRMLMADMVAHAEERGLVLNWNAGSGGFKQHRGAVPAAEFHAVYDRHLPYRRRLPWSVLRTAREMKGRLTSGDGPADERPSSGTR